MKPHVLKALDRGTPAINDLVRFDKEAGAIRELGGVVAGLFGWIRELAAGHVSEARINADIVASIHADLHDTAADVLAATAIIIHC